MYRPTYIKVDGNILENNIKNIISKFSDYKYYIAVVKNNAYHHGIYAAQYMINAGVNYLAVSSLEEAISLRKYFREIPILVLEPINCEYIFDAINNNITLTVSSIEDANKLSSSKLSDQLKVHMKIDSGMNRIGFKDSKSFYKAYNLLHEEKKILIEGIYTHLATSGVNDLFYKEQIDNFINITKDIDLNEIPIVHVDRSLTLSTHDKLPFVNGFRMGIMMYGFKQSIPTGNLLSRLKRNILWKKNHFEGVHLDSNVDLNYVLSFYSKVMEIRKIHSGEFVGYGAMYKAKNDEYIATIPVGYADGVLKSFGYIYINGKTCPIVAECMDMIMVRVDKTVKVNDVVEIIGPHQSVKDLSTKTGYSGHKFLNLFSNRVPIIYSYNDEQIEIKY